MPFNAILAEDHPLLRRMLKREFEARGFCVAAAGSGREAIGALTQSPYDLVVTDIRMETSTAGFDVLQAAKAQSCRPIVVLISAFPIPPLDWRNAGADAMFLKDGRLSSMFDEIARLLQGRAA